MTLSSLPSISLRLCFSFESLRAMRARLVYVSGGLGLRFREDWDAGPDPRALPFGSRLLGRVRIFL